MTEAVLSPKLKMTTRVTHYVDWFDLGSYLATGLMGAPENYNLSLLEAGNDTDYSVEVKLDKEDEDEFWKQERDELVEKLKQDYQREVDYNKDIPADKGYMRRSYTGVEHYQLSNLMIAAHERGLIEAGHYVVRLSW